jgi:hypothetical protein
MSFMRGIRDKKRRQGSIFVNKYPYQSPSSVRQSPNSNKGKGTTSTLTLTPQETAHTLSQRFRSPHHSNSKSTSFKNDKIKIGASVLEAIQIETEELTYPMTLYTLTDQLLASDTVMDLHAHPTHEEQQAELTSQSSWDITGIAQSMSRLGIGMDPDRRQRDLKAALGDLHTSIGSISFKLHSWEEVKLQLSSVLILPVGEDDDDDDDDDDAVTENKHKHITVGSNAPPNRHTPISPAPRSGFKRMALGRLRENKKKKIKKGSSFTQYLAFIKKKDRFHRSWQSRRKLKQIQQTKLPFPIDTDGSIGIGIGVGVGIGVDSSHPHNDDKEEPKEFAEANKENTAASSTAVEIESVSAQLDKLLRSKTIQAEREAKAKEIAERERILLEIQQKEEEEARAAEARKAASQLLRPLTDDEHELIQDALYGPGPESEKLAETATDSVQRKSMRTLRPGQWLNDEVIAYFFKMLAHRDEALTEANPGRKRSHFFNSFFFTKLFDEGGTEQYTYKNVKRWSKKVPGKDIFALDKIFFTCNVSQSHWTCAVVFMEEKRIQYYDSLGSDGYGYTKGLMRYLEDEWAAKKGGGELPDKDQWTIVGGEDSVPHQENGYDCGVFTCMFGDFLSLNRPLSFNQTHIHQCRERIALSILKGTAIE